MTVNESFEDMIERELRVRMELGASSITHGKLADRRNLLFYSDSAGAPRMYDIESKSIFSYGEQVVATPHSGWRNGGDFLELEDVRWQAEVPPYWYFRLDGGEWIPMSYRLVDVEARIRVRTDGSDPLKKRFQLLHQSLKLYDAADHFEPAEGSDSVIDGSLVHVTSRRDKAFFRVQGASPPHQTHVLRASDGFYFSLPPEYEFNPYFMESSSLVISEQNEQMGKEYETYYRVHHEGLEAADSGKIQLESLFHTRRELLRLSPDYRIAVEEDDKYLFFLETKNWSLVHSKRKAEVKKESLTLSFDSRYAAFERSDGSGVVMIRIGSEESFPIEGAQNPFFRAAHPSQVVACQSPGERLARFANKKIYGKRLYDRDVPGERGESQ